MTYPTPGPMGQPFPQQPTPPAPPPSKSSNAPVVILLVLILLALIAGGAYYYFTHLAPTSVAGTWDMVVTHSVTTSNGNAEDDKLTLQQNGNQVTGVASNNQGGGLTFTGTVNGQDIVLNASLTEQGTSCTLNMPGTISDANDMGGTWTGQCSNGGQSASDSGTWNATRTSS